MSLNERFQFRQLHIPHQQYLQMIAFDSLRMGIVHFFCFLDIFFDTRTITLLLLSVRFSVQFYEKIRKCQRGKPPLQCFIL